MRVEDKNWTTGTNNNIKFSDIVAIIEEYVSLGSNIFIGSDSFTSGGKVCFASTICLHGGTKGGRYFFYKENEDSKKYMTLVQRITEETRRAIELAELLFITHNFDPEIMEVHIDVSPFYTKNGTSKFSDMLKGYVSGYGFDCKIKPNAWASQSVADKHSK
tara:strand:+ start:518 stop:1000 length:483 start_codon:yes stop_codon:yes gene_type:complete